MMIFVQTRSHPRSKMATTGRWQSQTTMHLTHPVISTVHEESSCWNKPNADVNDDYKHPQLQNNTKRNTNAAAAIICSMASIQNYLKVLKQQTDRENTSNRLLHSFHFANLQMYCAKDLHVYKVVVHKFKWINYHITTTQTLHLQCIPFPTAISLIPRRN